MEIDIAQVCIKYTVSAIYYQTISGYRLQYKWYSQVLLFVYIIVYLSISISLYTLAFQVMAFRLILNVMHILTSSNLHWPGQLVPSFLHLFYYEMKSQQFVNLCNRYISGTNISTNTGGYLVFVSFLFVCVCMCVQKSVVILFSNMFKSEPVNSKGSVMSTMCKEKQEMLLWPVYWIGLKCLGFFFFLTFCFSISKIQASSQSVYIGQPRDLHLPFQLPPHACMRDISKMAWANCEPPLCFLHSEYSVVFFFLLERKRKFCQLY